MKVSSKRHSRSQKLRCCSDPFFILKFNHAQRFTSSIKLRFKYYFIVEFSIKYFQSINGIQWFLVRNLPLSPCVVFRPLDIFFFHAGLNRGFYFCPYIPVHRGVLSVVALNDRVLVPMGEYRFRGSFHGIPHLVT